MQLVIHFGFGIHCSAYFSTQRFPVTRPQTGDMAPKGWLSHLQPISQISIGWQRVRSTSYEDPQFVEEPLLAPYLVICREPFQSSSDQRLRPAKIEEPISVAGATVILEKRLGLFRLLFTQRQEILSTATFESAFSVSSVRQKVLERDEQKCTEPTFLSIRAGINFPFKQYAKNSALGPARHAHCIRDRARNCKAAPNRFGKAEPTRPLRCPVLPGFSRPRARCSSGSKEKIYSCLCPCLTRYLPWRFVLKSH